MLNFAAQNKQIVLSYQIFIINFLKFFTMKKLFLSVAVLMAALTGNAQESKVEFSTGADFVSSYVWRGALGAGTSIQPSLGVSFAGVSLTAWGSVDIASVGYKEVDFTLGYSVAGVNLAITDYWWNGEGEFKYLNYKNSTTPHLWEATVGYTLPVEEFPLSLTVNTMFAGADKKGTYDEEAEKPWKSAYSTYIEAAYPFKVGDIDLTASLGFTPANGLYASAAAVNVLSLKAAKEIKITDSFSLPAFGQIILNPRSEGIFFVFGVSL
jgi:hypothetical protein